MVQTYKGLLVVRMMNKFLFSIVIPTYNEEDAIREVVTELLGAYSGRAQIIIVDDASSDRTREIACRLPGVRVITHKRNLGYGAAVKTGIVMSSSEFVCLFDGDGQHDSRDIQRLYEALGDADMVVGSRGPTAYRNPVRVPGKLVLHWLANFLSGKRIPDVNSGIRIVRRKTMLDYLHLLPNGFSASTTMTMVLLAKNYDVKYIDVTARHRIGKSQVKQIRDGSATIMLMIRMLLLFNPMRFFAPLSMALFSGGCLYGAYKLWQLGIGLSVGSLMLILSGMITFMLGLVSDQIAQLRLKEYENPESIMRFQKRDSCIESCNVISSKVDAD